MMGKSTRRSAAIIVAGLAAVCSISVATTAGASTPPAAPDGSEVVSSEPNAAAVAFELAPYISEHVEQGKTLNFVYITNDLSSPYTAAQTVGVEKAIDQLGVTSNLQGPPTGAAEDQLAVIQTLIAQKKVDGIVVAAVNVDSLKPVIAAGLRRRHPADLGVHRPARLEGARVRRRGQHAPSASTRASSSPRSSRASRAPVVTLSVDTAAGWSTARMAGLEAGLAANPGLKIVGPINTGIEPGQMYNTIQNAMTANPDAIAIASVDCCSIDGAAKWAEQADRAGDIVIVGTDALKQTLNYIDDGTIAFSISQDPVGQVVTSITQLRDFVTDGTLPVDRADAAAGGHARQRRHGHARGMTDAPPEPAAVVASGLSKHFPGVVALDDVSIDVRAGRVTAVIGENGAGKSTLMSILVGPPAPGRRHRRRRRPAGRRLHPATTSPTVTGSRWCPRRSRCAAIGRWPRTC